MTFFIREDHLLALTMPYHNLLAVTRNDGAPAQTIYWDGNAAAPVTLNRYTYCLGNPVGLVDLDGKSPEDYEYLYYVNNPKGALIFGHTAFLLVKENGKAEYASCKRANKSRWRGFGSFGRY